MRWLLLGKAGGVSDEGLLYAVERAEAHEEDECGPAEKERDRMYVGAAIGERTVCALEEQLHGRVL